MQGKGYFLTIIGGIASYGADIDDVSAIALNHARHDEPCQVIMGSEKVIILNSFVFGWDWKK